MSTRRPTWKPIGSRRIDLIQFGANRPHAGYSSLLGERAFHLRGPIVLPDHPPRFLRLAACAALMCLLTACADTRGGPIPYDRALSTPDEPAVASLGTGYKIAPMDQLTIKVFNSK